MLVTLWIFGLLFGVVFLKMILLNKKIDHNDNQQMCRDLDRATKSTEAAMKTSIKICELEERIRKLEQNKKGK